MAVGPRPHRCYFKKTGFHQIKLNRLEERIPDAGPVVRAGDNPALDKLRKLINIYSDLYNNDLGNLLSEFHELTTLKSVDYRERYHTIGSKYTARLFYRMEEVMDKAIMDAWLEQDFRGDV